MRKLLFVFLSLIFIFATSCQDQESLAKLAELKAQSELEEQNKALAERWHYDLSIDRNWDVMADILSEDFVIHNPTGEDTKGLEETKMLGEAWEAMVNLKINHHEIIAEGEYVFIYWDASFDHTNDVFGIPASGNTISGIYGMDLFRIKDGKITDLWQNYDQLGMMQQMGAIPTP
jgi:steroid delta-isomerase-like uncharacterized protein